MDVCIEAERAKNEAEDAKKKLEKDVKIYSILACSFQFEKDAISEKQKDLDKLIAKSKAERELASRDRGMTLPKILDQNLSKQISSSHLQNFL